VAFSQVIYQPGPVARVIMNRPRYRNAQSRVMLEEMDAAFEAAAHDASVRVVVLSGAGSSFSSGHDLGTPEEVEDRRRRGFPTDADGLYLRRRRLYVEFTERWHNHPKPTIAMVHGYCTLGGWLVAAAMDLVFAAEDAVFHPGRVLQWFTAPYDLGPRRAKEVLFENRALTAREAMEMGFVSRVYPKADLERETLGYAARVAENDAMVNMMVKFSVNQSLDAMGYSTSARAGYHTQYVPHGIAAPREADRFSPGRRQYRFVAEALSRLGDGPAKPEEAAPS
jgi:enoyl-CoA hydratase